MQDKISAIVGSSGVGKSSLLNALQPGLQLRIGEVDDRIHKGRHTTTEVMLLPLAFRWIRRGYPRHPHTWLA